MSVVRAIRFFVGQLPSFSKIGFILRKLRWTPLRLNYNGQIWLVTGASGGIGQKIAEMAALNGAKVFAVARSGKKLAAMRERVVSYHNHTAPAAPKGAIVPIIADLSNMLEISDLVSELQKKAHIDVLINNVGILNHDYRETHENLEESYATNLLGHYHLTESLFKEDLFSRTPLIISMSSGGLYNQPLNLPLLNQSKDGFDGLMGYASHKRAQITLTDHWRRHYRDKEVYSYAMHPGWVRTPGVSTSLNLFSKLLRPLLRNPLQGADTALWLVQKRPNTMENMVWFDRKARSPYIFSDTRTPLAATDELIAFLEADLNHALK